jgi:selenide,water dikinase
LLKEGDEDFSRPGFAGVQLNWKQSGIQFTLLTRSRTVMPDHAPRARETLLRVLREERDVSVRTNCEAHGVALTPGAGGSGHVLCAGGARVPFDECVWCTAAALAPWVKERTGLAIGARGFIAVGATLESVNTPGVFACGDCAGVVPYPRPKAGVFAVRQGPPLLANLCHALLGEPLEDYEPQETFLGLITTGTRYCVASKGRYVEEGAWLWDLKDWIDRKWVAGYSTLLPDADAMADPARPPRVAAAPSRAGGVQGNGVAGDGNSLAALREGLAHMRCGGCGAKVGATVLSRVMARLRANGDVNAPGVDRARNGVLVGLDSPDDCAVLKPPPPMARTVTASVHTVDFFRSFIRDPYVFGQIAANHALSDVHAICANARAALAIAVVPFATEEKTEETLYQMMAGACRMLRESGCSLVGGHSCEGKELSLGFAVTGTVELSDGNDGAGNGYTVDGACLRKGGMRPGDAIVLTKALGTGALLAADMRWQAKGAWMEAATVAMLQSNRRAALTLRDHGATSCTDVTGFGFLGHLVEMVKASNKAGGTLVGVRVALDNVPLLPGARECIRAGIVSSLQPQNLRLCRAVSNHNAAAAARPESYQLLYDPQTAGGLLATVPAVQAAACVRVLQAQGYVAAAVIGEVEVFGRAAVAAAAPAAGGGGGDEVCSLMDMAHVMSHVTIGLSE